MSTQNQLLKLSRCEVEQYAQLLPIRGIDDSCTAVRMPVGLRVDCRSQTDRFLHWRCPWPKQLENSNVAPIGGRQLDGSAQVSLLRCIVSDLRKVISNFHLFETVPEGRPSQGVKVVAFEVMIRWAVIVDNPGMGTSSRSGPWAK